MRAPDDIIDDIGVFGIEALHGLHARPVGQHQLGEIAALYLQNGIVFPIGGLRRFLGSHGFSNAISACGNIRPLFATLG